MLKIMLTHRKYSGRLMSELAKFAKGIHSSLIGNFTAGADNSCEVLVECCSMIGHQSGNVRIMGRWAMDCRIWAPRDTCQ